MSLQDIKDVASEDDKEYISGMEESINKSSVPDHVRNDDVCPECQTVGIKLESNSTNYLCNTEGCVMIVF